MYSYITEEQFFAWNPALNGDCQGLYLGYYYCVANFGNDLPMPPTITASASPTATGTVSTCDAWYMTVPGDNCAAIAEFFGTFSEAGKPLVSFLHLMMVSEQNAHMLPRLHQLEPKRLVDVW